MHEADAVAKTKPKTVRTTVSLPNEDYAVLERIAKEKRVSVSWVVRDAVGEYLQNQWPLLRESAR
jgi:metal-responsive CopG/Arc/MetJ family transcriptional regulator